MVYPLYYGETRFSMAISGLDPYFTKFDNPALWHPNHFAIQPSAYSTDSFIDGLEKIGARGKSAIPTYARKCVCFLRTVEGKRVLTHANDVLQLRLQNQRKTLAEKQLLLSNDQALYDNLTEVRLLKCVLHNGHDFCQFHTLTRNILKILNSSIAAEKNLALGSMTT